MFSRGISSARSVRHTNIGRSGPQNLGQSTSRLVPLHSIAALHSPATGEPRYGQICLPDTWSGRRYERKAFNYWRRLLWERGGMQGEELAARRKPSDGLLLLEIDTDVRAEKTCILPSDSRFHHTDAFGQKPVRVADPTRWTKNVRWIGWLTCASAIWYGYVLLKYFTDCESVPITGRRRFNTKWGDMLTKMEDLKRRMDISSIPWHDLLLADGPDMVSAMEIIAKLIKASGLGGIPWDLMLVNAPGNHFCTIAQAT